MLTMVSLQALACGIIAPFLILGCYLAMPNTLDLTIKTTPGNRQHLDGLSGSAFGLAIASISAQIDGLTLVITENTRLADKLSDEITFFAEKSKNTEQQSFPDWETLPYDSFSPHQDIISMRLETLYELPGKTSGVVIVPITTLMHRLSPRSYVKGSTFSLKIGQTFDITASRHLFEEAGYRCVESAYEHGEFAVRGSILDLFPMGADSPCRIELFDDEIESLRNFDPETQLSEGQLQEINLLPGKEFPLDEASISRFRQNFRASFDIDVRKCPLYEDVSQGFAAPGIEYYLPLFFDQLDSFFDYLPEKVQICTVGNIGQGMDLFTREIQNRYEDRCGDIQRPILAPENIFLSTDEVFGKLKAYSLLNLKLDRSELDQSSSHISVTTKPFPDLTVDHRLDEPLIRIKEFIQHHTSPILICTESPGRRETLTELLAGADIRPVSVEGWDQFCDDLPSLAITVAPIEQGFWLDSPELIVIAENQLFTQHVTQARKRKNNEESADFIIKSLTELSLGSAVVHLDHGIGRYRGLENFDVDGQASEFLIVEYADAAKLYVPVASLHLISRYSGTDPDNAPLHKLGSDQWEKIKRKAQEKVIDVAAELLEIYAKREANQGRRFENPDHDYQLFTNDFPFEETEDQEDAIQAVIDDMTSEKAMDRLICGDVGFGKTEVAMRAAFVAAQSNTQVAVLVPTTLLAQQHYENFKDRFANWPVRVELISRFVSSTKQNEVLSALKDGKVDIVIGTHKLLNPDIKYHDLGLLVIDEEHRFGVRQKEQIKAFRANIDILTLTATPIPRTMNLSMSGVRDLSIIATPPARRLSIKTFVRQHNNSLIKEAVQRELLRGGQVFYLHNDVKTIGRCAEELGTLLPEARICIGHGQLKERELERVMSDFYHKKHNVLVCSTIIENGIDIPSANTIIIDRADKFGLAQLHQLRGRVGRSHHQAYAYLLTPHPKSITSDATKRLEAISGADTLGAGFTLASHDLEIRGAGEFLGEEQSGHMQMIGFTLYSEMLEQTVKMMKEGKHPDINKSLYASTDINLRIPALLPDDYLPDVHTRLLIYKRIANAKNGDELRELKVEMIDRFGLLPESAQLLFEVTEIKLRAEKMGIEKIEANAITGKIVFSSDTPVDPYAIVSLVQEDPTHYRLQGAKELRFTHECSQAEQRLVFINQLLNALSNK